MSTCRRTVSGGPPPPAWKYESPRLADRLLNREHLIAKIEHCLGKKRSSGDVFLMSAPAGFGKSTLLAQWALSTSVPVTWYHLDSSDDDPAVFLRGLTRALKAKLPRSSWDVEHVLGNMRAGAISPGDTRRAITVLIADIQRNVVKPLALILTVAPTVSAKCGAFAVLDGLLARHPDPLRIVVESRDVPRLRLSTLLTQRRLEGIGVDELRLRDDELPALLDLLEIPTDATYTESLRTLCAGWITGVLLATGAITPDFLPLYGVSDFDRERVFDYLAGEVIDTLPLALRAFATDASVLTNMTAPLCAALLELPDAAERLVAIDKRTGFVTRLGRRPQEPVYRFSPLLRQALLERLETSADGAARRRDLHERAGMLLDAEGDYEEAVQQFAQAEAYERIVSLINARRGMLLRSGRGATVMRWLGLLPDAARERHPELQVLFAELYRQAGKTEEAHDAAEAACRVLLPQAERHPALAARALAVRGDVRYVLGRYEDGRQDCEEAIRLAPADADEVQVQAHFTLASCLCILSTPEDAERYLAAIEQRCSQQRDLWMLARLYYFRSKLQIARGAYALAEPAASASLLYAQEANDELITITSRLNLGAIRLNLGRPESAREDLEAASVQAEAAGYAPGPAYALANLGDLELHVGNHQRAATYYEQAMAASAEIGDDHLRTYCSAGLSYVLALEGETRRAHELVETMRSRMHAEPAGADWAVLTVAAGVVAYRQCELDRAAELLSEGLTCAQRHDATNEVLRGSLYLAATRQAQERTAEARELVETALDTAAAQVTPAMLVEVRHLPELTPLIESSGHPRVRALTQEGGILASPSAQRRLEPAATGGQGMDDARGDAIRVFALGDARVLVGTERITHWRRPRVRELLFFLLDQGKPVRKDVILEAIWPDQDPDVGETSFRKARYYLKELLHRPCVAQDDGRWQLTVDCWLDTRELEQLAEEGERLAEEGHISAAAGILRRALTYWTGTFLEDCYSDWAILRRDVLQRRYLTILERLIDLEMRLGRRESAAQLCYQMLDADPHRESSYRGLMTYFAARGELAEAVNQFKRCANVLAHDLGVSPGPKTVALYQAIRSKMQASARELAQA